MVLLLAFAGGFALDWVWCACVTAVTQKRPLVAANMGLLLYFCTLISTLLIVDKNFLAVAAYAIGGWCGTYIVVRHK